MVSIELIDDDLKTGLKARNQLAVDTLRGLKTRIQNEQIAKGTTLGEDEIIALLRSEVKRRNDAATAFESGNRPELAEKEKQEAQILAKYLPAQADESDITAKIETLISENNWTAKDFGVAMGKLKAEFGASADGGTLSRILKDKLNS